MCQAQSAPARADATPIHCPSCGRDEPDATGRLIRKGVYRCSVCDKTGPLAGECNGKPRLVSFKAEAKLQMVLNKAYELTRRVQDLHGDDCNCHLCYELQGAEWCLHALSDLVGNEVFPPKLSPREKAALDRATADQPVIVTAH